MTQQPASAQKRQMFSRGLALALSLGLSLASAQSARQSTLVIGGDFSDLITMDPGVSYEFSGSLVAGNLYDTLVTYEGNDLKKRLDPHLTSAGRSRPPLLARGSLSSFLINTTPGTRT